jgi:actin-related protein 6
MLARVLTHRDRSYQAVRITPQVSTSDAGLVMTEPLLNLPSIQRTTLEVAFEQFTFQSFYSAPGPEFAVHKWAADNPDDPVAQSLSGVVLDAGYSFTHAVPIFDGRVRRSAVKRIRLGGKLLTNLLKEWVRRCRVRMHNECMRQRFCWLRFQTC